MQTIQEMTETWVAAGTKKGLKLPTRTNESEEIFLSKVKLICEASGVSIKESKRIDRKNGSGQYSGEKSKVTEQDRQVYAWMRSTGCSLREATMHVKRIDIGLNGKLPESTVAAIAEAWMDYGCLCTASEARQLAERGVLPE